MTATQDKYISTLIGCATGDSLGMPIEGMNPQQIKKYATKITGFIDPIEVRDRDGALIQQDESGILGYYTLGLKAGEYTDDTILTLALAESLVACQGINLEDIAKRGLAEYVQRLRPDGTALGGFGITTTEGFKNLLAGKSPLESGVIGGPGNTPAMKMSPLGLYLHNRQDIASSLDAAVAIGKITHLDPRSLASGVVQAYAIYGLLQNYDRKEFLEAIIDIGGRYEQPVTKEFSLAEQGSLLP